MNAEVDELSDPDVFTPVTGQTRERNPSELMCGFLHCDYKDIYGIRAVEQELRNTVVYLSCGFDRLPSRDVIDRSFIDLESVVNDIFDRLVKRAAASGLLELTYCIDSTDVRAMPVGQDASRCYDPTDNEYYYDCTIVPRVKIPIGAEFTQSKQASERTATHITRDALAVATSIWLVGDSIYGKPGWHDHLPATEVIPVASYNARNTNGSLSVEHRVEDCTSKHSEDAQLK